MNPPTTPPGRPAPPGAPPFLQEGRAEPASIASRTRSRRGALIAATILVSMAAYWLTRESLGEMAARSLSVVIIAAAFWATEALPLFATSFVVIGLQILFLATDGGLAGELSALLARMGIDPDTGPPRPPMTAAMFLGPLASDVVMLFLGGFLLAAAITKHGVDRLLADRMLRRFTGSPLRLIFGVLGVTAFLSMWMSNTAATAMMIAVVGSLLRRLPDKAPLRLALLLAVPFGANVGGIGTPIGTPPNAIAYGVLNQAGYEVTFLSWMLVAVPLEIMLLTVVGLMLHVAFRSEGLTGLDALPAQGALTAAGRVTLLVVLAAIVFWMTSGAHGLQPGVVALLAAAALTAFGILDRDDVDSIDWNILILMWGALSLSVGAEQSGLTGYIARVDVTALPGGPWMVGAVVAFAAMGLSTVMSNTATAALLVPAAAALSVPGREQFAMLAALSCSFAMALPVSTPPNAIAYATGAIPARTMLRAGGLISVAALVVMLLGYRWVLPLIF